MKVALYIEDGLTQVVLTPEGDHEKAVLQIAENADNLTVARGSFYECQGGYVRQRVFGERETKDVSLMLVCREQSDD